MKRNLLYSKAERLGYIIYLYYWRVIIYSSIVQLRIYSSADGGIQVTLLCLQFCM
jgi:hypothetical protein